MSGADWTHWRGPNQNGHALETGLPDSFDPTQKGKGSNVVWTAPYGGRSSPLVMGGRIYVLQGFGEGLGESERIVCLDEKSGKKLWEYAAPIFHSDVVSSRLGWTPLTADPSAGYVYANTTAGDLVCLDKDGKRVWVRQLTEEFGRFTGYGGRISAPIFDSGVVVIGIIGSSWGDMARGSNRFYAFDGKTGAVVWIADTGLPVRSTYQSNPVVAVIGGQRLLITGGGDGALHAFKVRTGERVWTYPFSAGHASPSPVVDGNLVYAAHGEENLDVPGSLGRVICVDASQIDPKTKKPKLVWEYQKSQRFGLSSPAVADGVLYVPEDSGELYAFDAKGDGKGGAKVLWRYRYGTEVRGAPLVADNKIYLFEVKGKLSIIPLDGKKKPEDVFEYQFREKGRQTETNGTPIAVNGRVYFNTRTELFCLADAEAKPAAAKYKPMPEETPSDGKVAGVRVFPAEVTAHAGEQVKFTAVYVDANGREVKSDLPEPKAEWTIATPAKTPTGAQPPPLAGKVEGDTGGATLTLEKNPSQQGYVDVKIGPFTARGRVRVAPRLPFASNFDAPPAGSSPGGWVNTNGKFLVAKMPDGNGVLSKLNTDARPPLAKAIAYVTEPTAADYTIQADLMGTEVRGKLPDAGLVNSRYTLVFDGKPDPTSGKYTVRITAWEARPRVNVAAEYDWKPGAWYTAKFVVEQKEKTALVRGKVWKKGEQEPAAWTIEFEDPNPTRAGAAGLYGYIPNVQETDGKADPGSELFFDNLSITPNGGKK